MKATGRFLLVVAVLVAAVVGVLGVSVRHAFSQHHEELQLTGRLPPANLARILVGRGPHPFGIASPAQCAAALVLRELREDFRYGNRVIRCGLVVCSAPVPEGAAAVVLDDAGIRTTFVPLTLAAEAAYRFVPREVLIDLYAEGYLRRFDLRTLAQEHLGIELEQASTHEILALMARAETAGICEVWNEPDIVRLRPVPSCDGYIAERLAELERDLARTGHLPHR